MLLEKKNSWKKEHIKEMKEDWINVANDDISPFKILRIKLVIYQSSNFLEKLATNPRNILSLDRKKIKVQLINRKPTPNSNFVVSWNIDVDS